MVLDQLRLWDSTISKGIIHVQYSTVIPFPEPMQDAVPSPVDRQEEVATSFESSSPS